jgi:hypothetical protein
MAIASATASPAYGNAALDWVVDVTLTPARAAALSPAYSKAVSACPAECPERHIAIWANLTADDISRWNEVGTTASTPYSAGGKLLTDSYVLAPIADGQFEVSGLTEVQAKSLASALLRSR